MCTGLVYMKMFITISLAVQASLNTYNTPNNTIDYTLDLQHSTHSNRLATLFIAASLVMQSVCHNYNSSHTRIASLPSKINPRKYARSAHVRRKKKYIYTHAQQQQQPHCPFIPNQSCGVTMGDAPRHMIVAPPVQNSRGEAANVFRVAEPPSRTRTCRFYPLYICVYNQRRSFCCAQSFWYGRVSLS